MNNFFKTTETTTITTTVTHTKTVEKQQQNHSPEPTSTKVHPVLIMTILSILDAVISVITGDVITAIRTALGF